MPVPCAGTTHHLIWDADGVIVADHPELDAELALIAFGGEEPPCLALRRLWLDAVADGGFLAEWVDETHLGRARLSWLAMALERMANEGFHEFLRELPHARAERMGRFLHRFPRPWLDRAAATVSEAVANNHPVTCIHAERHLEDAVAARVRRSFVEAVGGGLLSVGAAALIPLHTTVGPGLAPGASGRLSGPERGVSLVVDRSWLHEVWAAGLAVVDGDKLVLARDGRCLRTVSWVRSEPIIDCTTIAPSVEDGAC